jgi:methyltransferase (TIGR00027 family)
MASAADELTGLHRTAFSAAALRAAHTLAGAEPRIFVDELALALTGMTEEEALALGARVPPGSASTCVVRSRYTEDRLAAARARLAQYVVLGAGLDSYALRMADTLGELAVFEVDDPPFLAWKRGRIAALGLAPPPQLRFAPCDFERASIPDALAAAGFDATKPAFISWLGVTQYLTTDAIRGTLGWAGSLPAGSEIVLTFLESNAQAKSLAASMAQTGVAVLSDFTPEQMTGMLQAAGFSRIEHVGPAEANARYFAGRTDGLIAPEIQRLVSAVV